MVTATPAQARRRRDELVRRVHRAGDVIDVFAEASARLRGLVPFDAAVWLSTDPATGVPTAPTRVDDLDSIGPEACSAHWRHEYLGDDVNLFRDLARNERPAGSLRAAVDDPRASSRYRDFLRPQGFEDELRAVLRVGEATWGSLSLWRRGSAEPFTGRETALVAGLCAPLGEALRGCARPNGPLGALVRNPSPGLLLFDESARLASINEQARAWLDESPQDVEVGTDLGVAVPMWMHIVVQRAAAGARGQGDGTARTRVRTRRGVWLACHASCMTDVDGSVHQVAVVVEPAKPAEIAPIVVAAYDLTAREQQITRLIARGLGTAEIASELYLSPHTVRDHVKVIFQKVDVSSRGELVAKLFAEHYEPTHLDNLVAHRSDG